MSKLVFTIDPRGRQWELHSRPGEFFQVLLGWVITADQRELPGVPDQVARLLCRAWCRAATVTYLAALDSPAARSAPSSSLEPAAGWLPMEGGHRCRPSAARASFPASFTSPRIPPYELRATRSADRAVALFDDEVFCWERRAQRVLLSSPDVLPDVPTAAIAGILRRPAHIDPRPWRDGKVRGLVFPGVDGDFAEFLLFEADDWSWLEEPLRRECEAAGIALTACGEEDFNTTVWTE